jgi:hypothetical protein
MIESIREEKAELLKEMADLSEILHGSWVERYSTCSNRNCLCHKDQSKRHGPRSYLVVNQDGRQRQKYIQNRLVEKAKEGLSQHERLKVIIDRLTTLNLLLMKEDC